MTEKCDHFLNCERSFDKDPKGVENSSQDKVFFILSTLCDLCDVCISYWRLPGTSSFIMVRPFFRLLKAELKFARLQHHERFLRDCHQRNIIPYGFRSNISPCISHVSSEFRQTWSDIQFRSALELMRNTQQELIFLERECSSEIESITNSIIDDVGISEYLHIKKDVHREVSKFNRSFILREQSKISKFARNPCKCNERNFYHQTKNVNCTTAKPSSSRPSCALSVSSDDSVYYTPMADHQSSVFSCRQRKDFSPENSIHFTPRQSVSSHASLDCGGKLFLEHTKPIDYWDMDTSIVFTHPVFPSVTSTVDTSTVSYHDFHRTIDNTVMDSNSVHEDITSHEIRQVSFTDTDSAVSSMDAQNEAIPDASSIVIDSGFLKPTKENVVLRNDVFSNVINLSNRVLTEVELSVLSRGLSFRPVPSEIDGLKLKCDLDAFFRRLRLSEFFNTAFTIILLYYYITRILAFLHLSIVSENHQNRFLQSLETNIPSRTFL